MKIKKYLFHISIVLILGCIIYFIFKTIFPDQSIITVKPGKLYLFVYSDEITKSDFVYAEEEILSIDDEILIEEFDYTAEGSYGNYLRALFNFDVSVDNGDEHYCKITTEIEYDSEFSRHFFLIDVGTQTPFNCSYSEGETPYFNTYIIGVQRDSTYDEIRDTLQNTLITVNVEYEDGRFESYSYMGNEFEYVLENTNDKSRFYRE